MIDPLLQRLQITALLEQPQWLPLVAHWQQEQWRKYSPTGTVKQRAEKLQSHLSTTELPVTFVAFLPATEHEPALPLGCVSLVTYQFSQARPGTPWLANLFVEPDWRSQGIGSLLLDYCVQQARDFGLPNLFLFTHDKRDFYAVRGWQWLRKHPLSGQLVDIMSLQL